MQNVRITLTREARDLVGGDIVLMGGRPWTDDQREEIRKALAPASLVSTEVVGTQTMAARLVAGSLTDTRLVEIRAIEPEFPFYGALELARGQPYSHDLVTSHGALVQPELLEQFSLRVGDQIQLAGQPFTVRGVVTRDRCSGQAGSRSGLASTSTSPTCARPRC
jgi:putative ABC transport system permease protein